MSGRPGILARLRAILAGVAITGLLTGCSVLGGAEVLDVYELRPPADLPISTAAPLRREVIVELPSTTGPLETDRIMIRPDPIQAQYLPGVRWGEETPIMVQSLMLRSLSATDGVLFVGRRPLGSGGDFALVTDLVDFQAEVRGGEVVARISIDVRMVRERDVAIVAAQSFSAEATAAGDSNDQIIAAFNSASDAVLQDFTRWTLARLGRPL
ncbi:MAG: ABC-type transport auxiliary lipoprotein family protein [Pseudomonadota bacterium]